MERYRWRIREAFLEYEVETGVKDTLAVEGNRGAYFEGGRAGGLRSFLPVYKWEDMESMMAFAGPEPTIAVTYPKDDELGLISDPIVIIQEVTSAIIRLRSK